MRWPVDSLNLSQQEVMEGASKGVTSKVLPKLKKITQFPKLNLIINS